MSFSTFNSIQSFMVYCQKAVISYIYNFPALDSSLVLYYPFDISSSLGTTANYGSIVSNLPSYDASFVGTGTLITTTQNTFVTGAGDLSLNNTMGGAATNYVVANNSFTLNPSRGLTISCWFSCSGELNKIGTLISLPGSLNSASNALNIDSSLCFYYKFNQGDITGSNLTNYAPSPAYTTGTISANAIIDSNNYKVGNGSLYCNGSSPSYVTVTTSSINFSNFTNGLSFSVWYKSTEYSLNAAIFDFGKNTTNGKVIGLSTRDTTILSLQVIETGSGSGNNSDKTSTITYKDGNWHHYVWTLTYSASNTNTSSWNLYLDSVLKETYNNNFFPNAITGYNYIGKSNYGVRDICGNIDDFRMYARVLTQSEVTTLYNNYSNNGIEIDICGNSIFSGVYLSKYAYIQSLSPSEYFPLLSDYNNYGSSTITFSASTSANVGFTTLSNKTCVTFSSNAYLISSSLGSSLPLPISFCFWCYLPSPLVKSNNDSGWETLTIGNGTFTTGSSVLQSDIYDSNNVNTTGFSTYIALSDFWTIGSPNNISTDTATNTWNHICYTISPTNVIFYLNGTSSNTFTGTYSWKSLTAYTYVLGRASDNSVRYLNGGGIRHFASFNRVLTSTEVSKIYTNSS